jgi:hypothetical protein
LVGGGAQIVPSEQTLDPAKPEKTATFYLTPLALGWLRGARVEAVYQGRKVQEIPLKSKTVRQRATLILLLLTFLVPWLLATFKNSPPPEYWHEVVTDGKVVERKENVMPGEAVRLRLDKEIPPVNDWIYQNMFPCAQVLTSLTSYLGQVYDVCYHWLSRPPELPRESDGVETAYYWANFAIHYSPYFSFWILLVLTVLSFWRNQEKRKRKVGQPVQLPATPPASARHGAAVGAESGA